MASYHYLIASLPPLSLDGPLPFSLDDFVASCQAQLSEEDAADLRLAALGRPEEASHPFLREWSARSTQLANALARARGAARKVNALPFLHEHSGFDVGMDRQGAEAMALANPLERELALERLRWHTLDEMALHDPFGASPLFAFALKLRSVARWRALTEEAGQKAFDALVASNLESAVEGKAQR